MDWNFNSQAIKTEVDKLIGVSGFPTDTFWTIIALGIAASFFLGYLVNLWVGGSNRGFLATGIGLVLPWICGIIIFILARINIGLFIENPDWFMPSSIAIGALVFLFTLVIITPFILGVGFVRAIIVFFGNVIVAVLCVYLVFRLVPIFSSDAKIAKDKIVNTAVGKTETDH